MKKQAIKGCEKKDNEFSEHTFAYDLEETQKRFIHMLPEDAVIMDLGCGSGRDTLFFKNKGLMVIPVEESKVLCNVAAEHTGLSIRHMRPNELNEVNQFDGVWASAALIHLPYDEIIDVLRRVARALKPNGVLFMAFHYGTYEGVRKGRQCTDLNEQKFKTLLSQVKGLKEEWKTVMPDIRPESEQQWMNIFVRKIR